MSDVHEKLGVGNEPKPLSEPALVSRLALLYADVLRFKKLRELKLLTEEHQHQWRQTRIQLQELAALTIPRICSGELEDIGLEYTPGAREVNITLFEGEHRVPVGITPQIRELLPAE